MEVEGMKRSKTAVIIVLLIAVAGGAGFMWWNRSRSKPGAASNPYIPIEVRRGELSTDIYATGNVQTIRTVDVYPSKAGIVARVDVDEGTEVRAGDVLIRLERDELEVQQTEAEERQKRENLASSEVALEKIRSLHAKGAATEKELRSAESDVLQAKESYNAAALKLDRLVTKASDSVIRAPISGVVSSVKATVGAGVSTSNPVAVITDLSDVVVRVTVDEYDIGSVEVGQGAEVVMDALDDRKYAGNVCFVGKIGQNQSGVVVFNVDIRLDNPTQDVRPGMSAEASIMVDRVENALIVPNSVLETRRGETVARIYNADGSVQLRPVIVGLATDGGTEIVDGLNLGDMVAVPNPRAVSSNEDQGSAGREPEQGMPGMMPGEAPTGVPGMGGPSGGFAPPQR